MSLLDKASLVLIPSGTKEGTVFCQKPTGVWQDSTGDYDGQDGTGFNGQLDFTRASDATYVNSEGFIETARTNFLLKVLVSSTERVIISKHQIYLSNLQQLGRLAFGFIRIGRLVVITFLTGAKGR